MTTTSTFQGLNTDNKPSSRVLNPPGGSSSNIFGTDDQPQQRAAPVRSNQDRSNVQGQGQQAAASSPANPQQAKSRVPRSAFNPITGEPYEQPKPKQTPQPEPPAKATAESVPTKAEPAVTAAPEAPDSSSTGGEKVHEQGESAGETAPPPEVTETAPPPKVTEPAQPPEVTEQAQPAAPKPEQSQAGDGVFGSRPNNPREHTSTRVSQPPGGRSTKLW